MSAHPLRDRRAFRRELNEVLQGHLTLAHPIFLEIFDPLHPDLTLLRRVTLQGYQLTKNFIGYIEQLYIRCPMPRFKRGLLTNLFEEQTGKLSGTANHVLLMQDFIAALGITDDERDAAVPLPATRELIDYRAEAVADPRRYHVGAAAVMIASEGQNLETRAGEARHTLLARAYDLTEFDLRFFSVHQEEDVGHVEQGLNLVTELCTTPTMQREALDAVDHTCRLFHAMYEAMYQAYCPAAAAAR